MSRPHRVAVLGGDTGFGHELATGLVVLGASVAPVTGPWGSRAAVEAALADAADLLSGLDAVVDANVPASAIHPAPLVGMDPAGWEAAVEVPLRSARYALQASFPHLREGGRMIVVLPALAMSGAPGLVPWMTAAEGYRALAKVAARTWGPAGITVNTLAVAAELLAGSSDPAFARPGAPAPALGRLPRITDVAGAVVALLSEGAAFVTGATIPVDGGVWMTP